jgi:ATP-dependent Clp protease ATP-binding subunit ClpC
MNDTTLNELKIVVERSVRPVRAYLPRKRLMREELLAHLTTIFEEEIEKLGDEQAALDQAKQRFGEPKELTNQLQETVPFWYRVCYYFEKWFYQPGEILLRRTGRIVLSFALGYAFMLLIIGMPSLLIRGRLHEIGILLHVVFYTYAATMILCAAVFILLESMAQTFFLEESKHSLLKKMFYIFLSLLFFPAFGFLIYWMLTGDVSSSLVRMRVGCYLAPTAPLLFILMARQVSDEIRYKRQWSSLKIDE